jgi:hypothetical protein
MTSFSAVGYAHRTTDAPSPFDTSNNPFILIIPLPSPLPPHRESRFPFPMKIGLVTWLQTTIGQLYSPFLFSSCMYHQGPSISARRSILDDLATII